MGKSNTKKNSFIAFFSCLCILLSFLFVFVGGAASSETVIDDIASYTANVVQKNTKSGTYLGTVVEPNDNDKKLPDSVAEFNTLYGVFRQEKATFGSLFNADKKNNVLFSETLTSNLSIFCLGPNGTVSYEQHFKHYIYPFEMLFKDESYYDVSKYVAYLSTTQAEGILENRGVEKNNNEYTINQYKTLLGTKTILTFDEIPFEYVIGNIFLENNYYYECFRETIGDFFLTSYFAPSAVSKQHIYFLTSYVYQNKFFMNYLNKVYDSSFDISFLTLNHEKKIDTDRILAFRSPVKTSYDAIFIISCILSAVLAAIGYYLFYKMQRLKNIKIYCIHIALLFAPYLFFKLIFMLTQNIYFFSAVSTIANAILIGLGLGVYSFIFFYKKNDRLNKPFVFGDNYYEVNI